MTAPLPAYVPPVGSRPPIDLGISTDLILYVAAESRNFISMPPAFVPDEPVPYFGKFYAFWPVVFPDGVRVIVKVPLPSAIKEENALKKNMMKRECEMLQTLGKRGFSWSPRLLYHTMSDNNPLERPYIVHTAFPGKRLQWSDTFPVEKADREKVLAQIVRMNFDLLLFKLKTRSEILFPEHLGVTPEQWLENEVDYRIMRSLHGLDDRLGIDARTSLYLRILARRLLRERPKDMVFVLSHESLFSENIYIDENLNVTGFIEWGDAKDMPIRFAMRFPRFLNILNKKLPPEMPFDPKGYSKEFFKIPLLMMADREFFISRMQFEYATRVSRRSIGHLSPEGWEMMCWDLHNVDWNHMILEAVLGRLPHGLLSAHNFLVGCLPESSDGRIEDVIPQRVLYVEAWNFYLKYSHMARSFARPCTTGQFLYLLLCNERDWENVEFLLMYALGRPRPRA